MISVEGVMYYQSAGLTFGIPMGGRKGYQRAWFEMLVC